ncbi:MAG TPA: CotH kinase family protein [Cyclobacteriaceae bacterium]
MKINISRLLLLITTTCFFWVLTSCEDKTENTGPFAVDIGKSEIPYIIINTHDAAIQFSSKIPVTMQIYEGKELTQEAEMGIEYRGKTSYRLSDKKGYNIETIDGDLSFFGFPAEEDFRLIGHIVNLEDKYIFDRTLMYNFIGYEISRSIGRYASRCQFVELQINDEYRGVYVFMEKIKRDDNRVNIKSLNTSSANLTGGYILKIDKTDAPSAGQPLSYFDNNWDDDARYTESNSFRSRYDIYGNVLAHAAYGQPYHSLKYLETYFLYEYPKEEDITMAQKEYIANYIDQFETALLTDNFATDTRTYTNYIDLSSFVDFFILNELFRNVDAYRLSTFLQKDRDGKLAMGPIWDLDIAYDNGSRIPIDDWVIHYNHHVSDDAWMVHFWWPRLMQDPQFKAAVKARWNELRADQLSNSKLTQLVAETGQFLIRNRAAARNYRVWDQNIGVNYSDAIANLESFLVIRAEWMNSTISQF